MIKVMLPPLLKGTRILLSPAMNTLKKNMGGGMCLYTLSCDHFGPFCLSADGSLAR